MSQVQALLAFPCPFPIKVLGRREPGLAQQVTQIVLRHAPDFDPATARYLDTSQPVRFPVALSKAATSGQHEVKANVVYFYCSTREAWCRRGSVEILIPVTVR